VKRPRGFASWQSEVPLSLLICLLWKPPCHPVRWIGIPGVGTWFPCERSSWLELTLARWSPLTVPVGPEHLADKPYAGGSIAPVHSGLKENA
jgi:hypothetical protein